MKMQRNILRLRASVLAIHGAIGLLAQAQAQSDPALVEQTQPKSTVEFGIAGASAASAKANEWSGLHGRGAFGLLSFDWLGGSAYDSTETRSWRISGTDLGTDSRSLTVDSGEQGRYRVRFGYDELLRNTSDSYRTPYLGIGGNVLTLPSTWLTPLVPRLSGSASNARGLSPEVTSANGIVSGVSTAPTEAQLAVAAAVQAADLPAFQQVDLYTRRQQVSLGWEQEIDDRWSLQLAVSTEHKEGLKALVGHADAPAETATVLPHQINQDDDKLRMGLSYTGEALQMQVSYDISAFTNNVPAMSWDMWSLPGNTSSPKVASMSNGGPSNLFQKLQASGSYQFSKATRLVGNVSYARTWQNEEFPTDDSSNGTMAAGFTLPLASAQALVINKAAGLKLQDRSFKGLTLSAGLKVDQRENRTPVNTYIYYDNNAAPAAAQSPFSGLYGNPADLRSNVNINANTPYSHRVKQGDLDAVYRLDHGSQVKVGWNNTQTHRYCLGSWIDCANAAEMSENTLHADWHGTLGEQFSASVGVSAARRTVDYNELAFLARVPMANQTPATATGALAGTTAYSTLLALGLTGYGRPFGLTPAPAAGSAEAFYFTPVGTSNFNNPLQQLYYGNRNRMVEEDGLRTYDQANRDRNKARATLDWQANRKLTVQVGAEFSQSQYDASRQGLQNTRSMALNLDLNYAASDNFSFAVFVSAEDQRSRVAGNSIQTGVNSTATAVNGATAIAGDGACYTTIAERNANYKIDPCLDWTLDARDRSTSIGASLNRRKMFGGSVDVASSLIYSAGRSDNDVKGGFYVNNPYAGIAGAATKDIAAYYLPATAFPTIEAKSLEFRWVGTYHHRADQAVRVGYSYRWLQSTDWGYDAAQPGALVVALPTYETAPHYRVHMLGISYMMSFR